MAEFLNNAIVMVYFVLGRDITSLGAKSYVKMHRMHSEKYQGVFYALAGQESL